MSQKFLIIIPTYNELPNIKILIPDILDNYKTADMLIVDDNSPDGTGEYVARLSQKNNRIHLIKRPEKMGLGTAYIEGFKFALNKNYDFVFEMDADRSHDPEEIKNFLSEANEHDLIIGSRYIKGAKIVNWPFRRLAISWLGNFYARVVTGLPLHDTTSGFRCFKKKALESLDLDRIKSVGYSFQIEVVFRVWKNGLKIKEIPIVFTERKIGSSKMSKKIIWEAVYSVWNLK